MRLEAVISLLLFALLLANEAIRSKDIILSCVDIYDTKFAEFVLQNGKIYLDITTNYNYFRKTEELERIAKQHNGLTVLSLGLAPGLTNLMVKHLINHTQSTNKAEIFTQIGLGEPTGLAAVKWLIDNITAKYDIIKSTMN